MQKHISVDEFQTMSYKKSRVAYTAQCTFEYLISLLVTDAFLAKVLIYIGLSDSHIGIVSSFIHFSFLFQLLSIFLVERIKTVKRTVVIFDSLCQVLYICLYCVPFLNCDKNTKIVIAVATIFLAYFFKYLVSSILFKWANSYVEPGTRGRFSAFKEIVSLIFGMIFTLIVGLLVDKYESDGNIKYGFGAIVIILFLLNALNFVSLINIKDKKTEKSGEELSLRAVLKNTIGNKKFRNVIILLSMWNIAICITNSFMGTFKTKDLLLSVGLVQIINTVANGIRMAFSVPLGKYADKKSYARGLELAMIVTSAGFVVNMFTTNNTWWLVVFYTIFYNVGIAGTNANKFNITYSYVKNEYIVHAMAIQNCISGVCGFCATLIGSYILSFIQNKGNILFGISLYGQQVLSLISLMIAIFAIIFDRTVVEKQKVILQ